MPEKARKLQKHVSISLPKRLKPKMGYLKFSYSKHNSSCGCGTLVVTVVAANNLT